MRDEGVQKRLLTKADLTFCQGAGDSGNSGKGD